MDVKIFPAADAKLVEIWSYTEETWGEKQADKYIRELVKAIMDRAAKRGLWKSLNDPTLKGVYYFRHAGTSYSSGNFRRTLSV